MACLSVVYTQHMGPMLWVNPAFLPKQVDISGFTITVSPTTYPHNNHANHMNYCYTQHISPMCYNNTWVQILVMPSLKNVVPNVAECKNFEIRSHSSSLKGQNIFFFSWAQFFLNKSTKIGRRLLSST